jgi:hypothetical protein
MNLKEYLSKKGKAPKGKTTDWLHFCSLDIKTGALWAGDPHLGNAEDGCVVRVPRGQYAVEAMGMTFGRERVVSRLRVRLVSAKNPKLGKEVGETGTDSAMIGVCDIKAFEKAYVPDPGEELQEEIEAQTDDGFGIITLKNSPGAVMPFVPTGSDGSGPVFALMSGKKCVGMELPFMGEDEEGQGSSQDAEVVTLLGDDRDDFITRLVDGKEVSFWIGIENEAALNFSFWTSAPKGPVEYRIRRASGSVVKSWSPMKKVRGAGATFSAVETLKIAGKYEVDFRIGEEVFSALKLITE